MLSLLLFSSKGATGLPEPVLMCSWGSLQGAVEKVAAPRDLFQALYHHCLCLADKGLQLNSGGMGPTPTPTPSGSGLAPPGAAGDAEAERLLCIRAMAAVYSKHAGPIGGWGCAQQLRPSLTFGDF